MIYWPQKDSIMNCIISWFSWACFENLRKFIKYLQFFIFFPQNITSILFVFQTYRISLSSIILPDWFLPSLYVFLYSIESENNTYKKYDAFIRNTLRVYYNTQCTNFCLRHRWEYLLTKSFTLCDGLVKGILHNLVTSCPGIWIGIPGKLHENLTYGHKFACEYITNILNCNLDVNY